MATSAAAGPSSKAGIWLAVLGDPDTGASETPSVTVTLQFEDQGDHDANVRWVRALFVACVSQSNQLVGFCNVCQNRAIFPDDLKPLAGASNVMSYACRVNLAALLQRRFVPDVYYLSASARSLLSATHELHVK